MDIEAYLDGIMPAEEKAEFEKKLHQDAVLRKELEQFRALKTDLDWHFAAKDVAAANALRAEIEARRHRWARLLLAALLVFLAGLFVFWLLTQRKPVLELPRESPVLQQPTTPPLETPVEIPPLQQIQTPSRPMAGNIKPRQDDLLRNLPAEEVPAATLSFFEQQWAGFTPAVPEMGTWAKPLQQIRSRQVAAAYKLLLKAPSSDTASYLLAVSELMLKRPSAAQALLYPLAADKKWQTEAQYLLVWAYLLEGNSELAKASLKALPEGFRDKDSMKVFLGQ